MTMRIEGWILDVYPEGDGIAVWIIDRQGASHCLRDRLAPSFFVYGPRQDLHAVCAMLVSTHAPVRLQRTQRRDLFRRCELTLLEVQVEKPLLFSALFRQVRQFNPALEFYNADLAPAQIYYFERDLFPLAHCEVLADELNCILEIQALDSRWDLEYKLPSLNIMSLQLQGEGNPNHGFRGALQVQTREGEQVLGCLGDGDDERDLLLRLRTLLVRTDPDLILSEYGDSFILPHLLRLSRRYAVPLPWNRGLDPTPLFRKEYSYMSYGRVVHRAAAQTLLGRWHIDLRNAFLVDDYALEGVFELARLTGLGVQKVVRTSTGTGISNMEAATAYRHQILIPYSKREAEDFKSAGDLIVTDKGGLTYRPIVGLHENVAELDFVSMYPFIMAKFNISPETINCPCCLNRVVPEIGYSICARERGLVPETLEPLVTKRIRYKMLARQLSGAQQLAYTRRAKAIKWVLVTCFGYTGYKNARFGKIEAHESINAYGRAALIQAKEIVEARGFSVLHMLVDSLWITRPNTSDDEYGALLTEITHLTDLPIGLEGIYNWVAFLPSRQDGRIGVPNRYFGVFRDGEVKLRGIEARRGDTPPWIKHVQQQAIAVLAQARTRPEFATAAHEVIGIARGWLDELRAGRVDPRELVLTYRLSRAPHEYRHNTLNAQVARELVQRGVRLAPGESIRYIVQSASNGLGLRRVCPVEFLDPAPGTVHPDASTVHSDAGTVHPDAEYYGERLLRALETILQPAGLTRRQIDALLSPQPLVWQMPLKMRYVYQ